MIKNDCFMHSPLPVETRGVSPLFQTQHRLAAIDDAILGWISGWFFNNVPELQKNGINCISMSLNYALLFTTCTNSYKQYA